MIIKLLFFIGWLGLAVLSMAGMLTSIIPKYADLLDFSSWLFRGGLFVVSLFYFLLVVEKLTALFIKDDKAYEFRTDKGLIKVSSLSVNNLIKEIVEKNKNVRNVKVTSIQGKKGLKVTLKLEIMTLPNLSEEYANIQDIIILNLKEKLNIEVDTVDINTGKLITNSNITTMPDLKKKTDIDAEEAFKVEEGRGGYDD